MVPLLFAARPASAQEPRGYEAGIEGLLLAQDPVWGGAALSGAWRPGGGARFSLAIGAGGEDGRVAGRGEVLAHFLLSPAKRAGAGLYLFGGAAGTTGPRHQGYLVLGLGVEGAPGGTSGWFLEGGVGGGARIGAGWRWRWLIPRGRPAP